MLTFAGAEIRGNVTIAGEPESIFEGDVERRQQARSVVKSAEAGQLIRDGFFDGVAALGVRLCCGVDKAGAGDQLRRARLSILRIC